KTSGKTFTLTDPSEIHADANGIIATIGFRVYLTKDSSTTIALLPKTDTISTPCDRTTITFGGIATFNYTFLCNERALQNFLNGTMPMKIIAIHPNPASDEIAIDINSQGKQDVPIEITNALGAHVFSGRRNIAAGNNSIRLDTKNLSGGMYLI